MSISVNFEQGNSTPRIVRITTTSTFAQVTTAGWYNNVPPNQLVPSDQVEVAYAQGTNAAATALFSVAISSGVVTLSVDDASLTGPSLISTPNASATPGTIRSLTGSLTSTATVMTSGNLVGVRGVVTYVGASAGFLYGIQGKLIASGTLSGSSWNAALFGQLDISGATVNAGQTAAVWGDYGATSGTITSATGMRMFAGTNTTAATLNSMIYLYGKTSNLLELDANGSTYIADGGTGAPSGTIKKIAILIEGVQYYLLAATVIS